MFNRLAKNSTSLVARFSTKAPKIPAFNYTPEPYTGPSIERVDELRKTYLNPAIFHYYKKPLMIVDGKMQYLFDQTGRRYLDLIGGIVTISVGHCHPKIVKAGMDQMKKLMHTTTIYYNDQIAEFAKSLADRFPGKLKVCYFVNSGSEANDLAILLAKLYTGNNDVIALRNCYHGLSMNTMGITGVSTWKYPVPQGEGVHHALCPDTYKGVYQKDDPNAATKYAADVKQVIEHSTPGKVAGFIAEPVQGVGGTVVLPDGYLKEVYKHVRAAGGVCISDEVQAGFGRCGTHYWGFETQGVMPDIVTMAKGIGNGTPLGAVVTTPEIAQCLKQRIHFNTFGGNPVSMAIGRAVLDVIDEEHTQKNSLIQGEKFLQGFRELQKKYSIIGDVRGKGLLVGVELVKDRKTKEPATEETAAIFERVKDLGVLTGKGGLRGNVFRIKPPMCITSEDVKFTLECFDQAFSEISH